MKVNSIEWHKYNLKNLVTFATSQRERAKEMVLRSDQLMKDAEFYAEQIDEAARRGKASFDADRFMRKKGLPDVRPKTEVSDEI